MDPASSGSAAGSASNRVATTLDPVATVPVHYHQLPPGLAADYELLERLGGGGEATVYRARDLKADREVALKVYNIVPSYSFEIGDEEHRAHFIHAHTVDLYERRKEGDLHVEVMELCPLGTLDVLADGKPMSLDLLAQVIREVSEALHSMHPMYHGDIKPQNILVRSREPLDLVLTDFGLSKNLRDRARKTSLGQGTHLYQPPEAAYASQLADDWWALGMVVAELAAGYHPFDGVSGQDLNGHRIREYLTTHRVPLDQLRDSRIRLLCSGLLTRSPEARWGYDQVAEWLAGGSPEVAEVDMPVPAVSFPFDGVLFREPAKLGEAMRASESGSELGQGVRLQELLTWLEGTYQHARVKSISARAASFGSEVTAALIATVLVDDGRAVFRHLDLTSPAGLAQASQDAELLKTLATKRLLRHFGSITNSEELTALDHRWQRLVDQVNSQLRSKVAYDEDPALSIILASTWRISLDPAVSEQIRSTAEGEVCKNSWLAQVEWLQKLRDAEPTPALAVALLAALPAATSAAKTLEAEAAAETARKEQEEQERIEADRQEQKRLKRVRGERRREKVLAMFWPMFWMGVVWQSWLFLAQAMTMSERIWPPIIGHLIMMALVMLIAAPVAGRLRFEQGSLLMLLLMAGLVGMASYPVADVFADGWSPYRMLGFAALSPDARFWPQIAGVIVAATYSLFIHFIARRDEELPRSQVDAHVGVASLALAVGAGTVLSYIFLANYATNEDPWRFVHISGVAASFAFLYMAVLWSMAGRRGFSWGVVLSIMSLVGVGQVVYFLNSDLRNYFRSAQKAACQNQILCPEPGGFGNWMFTPLGLGLVVLALYAVPVTIISAVQAANERRTAAQAA